MHRGARKTGFVPSEKQLKFARYYLDFQKSYTQQEIAKLIKTNVSTIWRWFQVQDFVDWLNDITDDIIKSAYSKIVRRAVQEALKGEFNYTRLLMEKAGRYVPIQYRPQEVPQVNVQIIDVHSPEDVTKFKALKAGLEGNDNGNS